MVPRGPIKLQDCKLAGPGSSTELFIVEGDSAAWSVAALCNPQSQAVLPMQGKPLNALKANISKVNQNPWLQALMKAIGSGVEPFEMSRLRYQTLCLLMDPDADGIHCGALMLMFFHRWMRPLLEEGRILMVRAPVGEWTHPETGEIGFSFTQSDFLKKVGDGTAAQGALRYRGLGNISPTHLRHWCVDPSTRQASVMTLRDAEMAIEVFGHAPAV